MEKKLPNSGMEEVVKRELEKQNASAQDKPAPQQTVKETTFPLAFRRLARILSGEN